MASVDKTVAVLEAIVREEYEPLARKWVTEVVDAEIRLAEIRIKERVKSLMYDLRFNFLVDQLSERGIKLSIEIKGLE